MTFFPFNRIEKWFSWSLYVRPKKQRASECFARRFHVDRYFVAGATTSQAPATSSHQKELKSSESERKNIAFECFMLIFWQIFNMKMKTKLFSTRLLFTSFYRASFIAKHKLCCRRKREFATDKKSNCWHREGGLKFTIRPPFAYVANRFNFNE